MFHSNGGLFKTIVLALDRSEGSKRAIPVAAEIAEKEHAKVVIAHVTEYLAAKSGELRERGEIRRQPEAHHRAAAKTSRPKAARSRTRRRRRRRGGSPTRSSPSPP